GNRMDPQERAFLDAVEKGDLPSVARWLSGTVDRCPVSVNCTDMLGRSAIQIAVDNENIELVELLLKQEGVKIGEYLSVGVPVRFSKMIDLFIYLLLCSNSRPSTHYNILSNALKNVTGSPPIKMILAAYCNQFEILQLLLIHGATIDRPHPLSCPCRRCQIKVHADGLRHSLLRINTYRALASPAWISLTSLDPILTAFRLSWELDHLALRENEFKDSYSQVHVGAIVRQSGCPVSKTMTGQTFSICPISSPTGCVIFVAHPHCQQLLTSIWYEGLPGWRKRNGFMKFLTCIGLILLLPFISLYYLLFPRSRIGQMLRSPFMKFLYHSASFGVFLFLLVCASTDIISNSPKRERFRGPEPSELEWMIVLWVTGFVWAECKQLWDEGLKAYIRQWWNWLDFIMLSLYLCTFSLRLVAYFQIESGRYGPREMRREEWPQSDPTIISEGLFAIANVFSFARIIYLFQANQYLGPLQISLGCMLIDIAKFLFIFFLVVSSFACGLNQLYWYYSDSDPDDEDLFFTLFSSYVTLFWSMFSLTAPQKLEIRSTQTFTRTVGELMFMAYHGMAIIVLLNMLIAMMSSSFQEIENHADMEWKFARSKLWMGYFDEGSTLPAPFNMIISPKSVYYLALWIKRVLFDRMCRKGMRYNLRRRKSSPGPVRTKMSNETLNNNRPTNNGRATESQIEPPVEESSTSRGSGNHNKQYQEVMRRLICRYIHHTKKEMRQCGVNADDLLEIKQDISSLRQAGSIHI
ncbi:hypothetical protein EGW08_004985, partial [Elysia chlorotica]